MSRAHSACITLDIYVNITLLCLRGGAVKLALQGLPFPLSPLNKEIFVLTKFKANIFFAIWDFVSLLCKLFFFMILLYSLGQASGICSN